MQREQAPNFGDLRSRNSKSLARSEYPGWLAPGHPGSADDIQLRAMTTKKRERPFLLNWVKNAQQVSLR